MTTAPHTPLAVQVPEPGDFVDVVFHDGVTPTRFGLVTGLVTLPSGDIGFDLRTISEDDDPHGTGVGVGSTDTIVPGDGVTVTDRTIL